MSHGRGWAATLGAVLTIAIATAIAIAFKRTEPTASRAQTARAPESATATAPPQERSMAVEQVVLHGTVSDTSHAPIAGASVCAVLSAQAPSPKTCTSTGADGSFSIQVPPSADYELLGTSEEHLPKSVVVSKADITKQIQIVLLPGGHQLRGRVEDPYGGPVSECMITVKTDTDGSVLALLRSDTDGFFAARVPEPDIVAISESEGFSTAIKRISAPATSIRMIMTPGVVVSGQVLARDTGKPIKGTRVFAGFGGIERIDLGLTDADGKFVSSSLAPGTYELEAEGPSWRTPRVDVDVDVGETVVTLLADPAGILTAQLRPEIGSCDDGEVHLSGPVNVLRNAKTGLLTIGALAPGSYRAQINCPGHIPLRDEFEIGRTPISRDWRPLAGAVLKGRVVTVSGYPVAGVTIIVALATQPYVEATTCVSDERGLFACGPLEKGEYTCFAASDTTPLGDRVPFSVDSAKLALVELRLGATGTIRVAIRSDKGARIDDVTVYATGSDGSRYAAERRGPGDSIFARLPSGTYDVGLAAAKQTDWKRVDLRADGATANVELTVTGSQEMHGVVVDEEGEPVSGAWVDAKPTGSSIDVSGASVRGISSTDGTFELTGVGPGPRTVTAWSTWGEASVTTEDPAKKIKLTMTRLASISGTVRTSNGDVVKDFLLTRRDSNGNATSRRISSPAGEWHLSRLNGKEVTVRISSNYGAGERLITLEPGNHATVPIVLTPAL
jgi:protocatechuate 3,4-dioxygenase beta subunit